jgi:hypothetical protein
MNASNTPLLISCDNVLMWRLDSEARMADAELIERLKEDARRAHAPNTGRFRTTRLVYKVVHILACLT